MKCLKSYHALSDNLDNDNIWHPMVFLDVMHMRHVGNDNMHDTLREVDFHDLHGYSSGISKGHGLRIVVVADGGVGLTEIWMHLWNQLG